MAVMDDGLAAVLFERGGTHAGQPGFGGYGLCMVSAGLLDLKKLATDDDSALNGSEPVALRLLQTPPGRPLPLPLAPVAWGADARLLPPWSSSPQPCPPPLPRATSLQRHQQQTAAVTAGQDGTGEATVRQGARDYQTGA